MRKREPMTSPARATSLRQSARAPRPRRQTRMASAVLQTEVPFAPDQLHPDFVELQAHAATTVDQLGQEFDHVRFGELRTPECAQFFANTFRRNFGQRDPQVVRKSNQHYLVTAARGKSPAVEATGLSSEDAWRLRHCDWTTRGDSGKSRVLRSRKGSQPLAASVRLVAPAGPVFGKNGRVLGAP